jgi:hypothetical protein
MKQQKDLLEGRTKEWNSTDYQGRSKKQIEANETLATASVFVFTIIVIAIVVINALANG